MYIVLLGAPGAGKGTQASRMAEQIGLAHVASGDLFREALSNRTELGLLAKSYMDRGALVPDEVTIRMIFERVALPDCAKGVILDGFPRTIAQAEALDRTLAGQGKNIDLVLYIKVSEDELLSRLGGRWLCRRCQAPYHIKSAPPKVAGVCDVCGGELYQRTDDSMETARNRLVVYFDQTAPLIEYYQTKGKLVEVDGEQEIEAVTRELVDVVRARQVQK
ncbi:MAG: adenylate kinase [Chloroflexota bacterium]|nr:MAG: adenylate kinase [Chloroflexota bacterium]